MKPRFIQFSRKNLFSDKAYSFLNVLAALDFVDERNGVVRIAYNAFAFAVYRHIVARKNIFAGSLAVRLEIRRGTDKRPFYVVSLFEFKIGFHLRRCKRNKYCGEIGRLIEHRVRRNV